MRDRLILAVWFVVCFSGVAFIAFDMGTPLRVLGWVIVSLSLWLSGLIPVGGLFDAGKDQDR